MSIPFLRIEADVTLRTLDRGGDTIKALQVSTPVRMHGDAVRSILSRPDIQQMFARLSWHTGAGHTTGLDVVYGEHRPQTIAVRDEVTGETFASEVSWSGADGLIDSEPDPQPMIDGPTRAMINWVECAKYALRPDLDLEPRMPDVADQVVLRRRGRVKERVNRAGAAGNAIRPPLEVEKVERIVELREKGWSARQIADEIGCARYTVSRYLRSFGEKPGLGARSNQLVSSHKVEQMIKLYDKGMSVTRISTEVKSGWNTVRRELRKAGRIGG